MAQTSLGYQVDKYTVAQSFFVKEQKGIFLTAIDLYFKTIAGSGSTTLPVAIEVRPMNDGFPSAETIIPGSEVSVSAANVNFSTNASSSTRFLFDEPIFLRGPKDYAFVVSTNTSQYELFAAMGDTFVIGSTEKRISKQQTLGSMFFSQNAATFTPAQELDISFKLIHARFKHTSATATLRNATLPNRVLMNNPLKVTATDSRVVVNHLNHGFQPKDKINFNAGGGTVGGITSAQLSGIQTIDSADFRGYSFRVATNATTTSTGGGAAVSVEKNIPYHKVYPNLQVLEPQGTIITAGFKGTLSKQYIEAGYGAVAANTRYTKQSSFQPIILNADNNTDIPYAVISDRIADSASISNQSTEMQIKLETSDSNVSPLIDLQRASLTLIANQIDKQASSVTAGFNRPLVGEFVAETSPGGGSSAAKHITKVVTLTEDAKGLKILLSANRPVGTDFEVYYRTASQDGDISTQNFVLLSEDSSNQPDNNPQIFRDYEYLAGGIGGSLIAFKKFQIKIVMRSGNQAKAPMFRDLRIIALSV